MREFSKYFGFLAVFTAFLLTSLTAKADDLEVEGDFTFTTDYIFRGVSRSNGAPAFQLTLDFVHENGLYAGVFASNFKDNFGHEVETDLYAGYLFSKGAYEFNFSVAYNSFHGGGDTTGYFEFQASVSRDFGLVYLTTGLAFSPSNREFGTGRSIYMFTAADLPIPIPSLPPTYFSLKVGYEDFSGGVNKWDWSVGLYTDVLGLEWGLKYTDTNRNIPGAGGSVLASVRGYF